MKIKHLILAFAAATIAFASCDKKPNPRPTPPGPEPEPVVETLTIAEFIAKADTQTEYQIVGTLTTDATNGSFKGFDMSDETGSITVAFPTNIEDFLSDLKTGAVATVVGKYQYYEKKGTHQLSNGTIKSVVSGKEPEVVEATCQEVIESADPLVIYKVSGKVGGPINTTYGNFDIIDETGSLYVYGVTNWAEYKDKVAENGAIVLQGKYQFYNGTKHELVNATILSFEPSTDPVIKVAASTQIAHDCLEATITYEVVNPVEGKSVTIADITTNGYGTITLEEGAVKVAFTEANTGDTVKDMTFTLKYEGAADAVCTVTQKVKPSGDQPSFESTLTWTNGTNAYAEQEATINEQAVKVYKLSTSSKPGDATITVPAGTTKIGFYALGWKGATGTVVTIGDKTITVDGNDGVTGNAPYTITVEDPSAIYYTVEVTPGDVKVSCPARVIFWGLNPVK